MNTLSNADQNCCVIIFNPKHGRCMLVARLPILLLPCNLKENRCRLKATDMTIENNMLPMHAPPMFSSVR